LLDNLALADQADPRDYVAGVYRVLRGEVAAAGPGHYSAPEFDLTPLTASGLRLLELGRSCIAPDFRGGIALQTLWQGLAAYVIKHEIDLLFGVASFKGTSVADYAQALSFLHHNHRAKAELCPLARPVGRAEMDIVPADEVNRLTAVAQVPNLIKSYLRLGGVVGDGAFIDHDFNTIDVCLVLDTRQMADRFRAQLSRDAGS